MIPVLLFSAFVIPLNFIIVSNPEYGYVDYMLLMNANGFVPVISDFFIDHHIRLLFSFLMLFVALGNREHRKQDVYQYAADLGSGDEISGGKIHKAHILEKSDRGKCCGSYQHK